MSAQPASRTTVTADLFLADVLAAVQTATLPARRRQEMRSAVRTIARVLDKPPERVPANPRLLAARLSEVAPRACGISPARWNNIRSLARAALALVQPMSPGRQRNALSPAWKQLWEWAWPPAIRVRGAVQAQLAVAIEILLMAPIRLGNLTRLDLDRNLVRPGRGDALHIVIEPEEVKNREPLEYPLPAQSARLIEQYLHNFRPHLAPASGTALFPGLGERPKNQQLLGKQISRTVRDRTGLRVHPHLFRHIAAKLFLDENPGSYEVVRRVLGQRSIDTTTTYYTGLETAAGVRHFDNTILKLRDR